MVDAVVVDSYRAKLAENLKSGNSLPKASYIQVGSGGHNATTLMASTFSADTKKLVSPHDKHFAITPTVADKVFTAKATIEESDLVGKYLSEAGLFDEDGNLIAYKTFSYQMKDGSDTVVIQLVVNF